MTNVVGVRRAPAQRVLPSLFDRLRSDGRPVPVSARAHCEHLRSLVLRDLHDLLNSVNHEHLIDSLRFGSVCGSCWNFGMASVAGRFTDSKAWRDIEFAMRLAIERFEPRIVRGSIELSGPRQDTPAARYNLVSFEIRGLIRAAPQTLPFTVHSSIDLETSRVSLGAAGSARADVQIATSP